MHPEILNPDQAALLPFLSEFSRDSYLAGGTATALFLGHRKSVDFDLFFPENFSFVHIQKKIAKHNFLVESTFVQNRNEEYTIVANGVKLTFLVFPFLLHISESFGMIRLPALLDLAATKAYALGRRGKWKDYVDLFFLFAERFSLSEISVRAEEIFGGAFNEKIFRVQLCYFDDVDFSESVEFMPGKMVSDKEIREFLEKKALE